MSSDFWLGGNGRSYKRSTTLRSRSVTLPLDECTPRRASTSMLLAMTASRGLAMWSIAIARQSASRHRRAGEDLVGPVKSMRGMKSTSQTRSIRWHGVQTCFCTSGHVKKPWKVESRCSHSAEGQRPRKKVLFSSGYSSTTSSSASLGGSSSAYSASPS